MTSPNKLRVGILGAGEVAQVIHLPTLALLSHLYTIEAICDISRKNAEHCAQKFLIPLATSNHDDIINHPAIDLVFTLTSDEFHASLSIAALKAGKHVFVEKPLTLSIPSAKRIIAAEKDAGGPRVFVGYMRRYAASFVKAFKREVESIPRILYARVRDFSGPNKFFVDQSGTFQVKNTDFPAGAGEERDRMLHTLFEEAFEGKEITEEKRKYCRFLGSLGSHDISLMREVLGSPESVAGVSLNEPFYSAIFNFRNKGTGEPYAVTYESGIDAVPNFDAHLAVYGKDKRVEIRYDSPYVKGLPIKVKVEELNEHGEMTSKEILTSYEDAYTAELQELYACLVDGKGIKTTAEDALEDIKIFDMMYKKYDESIR
ncbi:hypothetical protein H2201_006891 [Coniosporium apollinis]|uniref:Gfo/Idh/MocA-like oxidoreductase N-terminal domain-containing protein n=2 Tax=Coniosporium TaxID=2810619 RepID=A0ABQ9NS58_9PEZI|nr:hypothetical protein H2199_005875 [Cladosporium sp. JES 115]KAJ9660469.1 hypothetical protein H2201_006891 [Coniosporium apollinis]